MPINEFVAMAASTSSPSLSNAASQPLSLVLLLLTPFEVDGDPEALARDLELGSTMPKPAEIAAVMVRSRLHGYASMIQPANIDDFTCEVDGDLASGTVEFHVLDEMRARVAYVATRIDRKWQVQRFSLPSWGVETVRMEDGTWQATGAALLPSPAVPRLQGLVTRPDFSRRRLVVDLFSGGERRIAAANIAFRGRVLDQIEEDVEEELPAAIRLAVEATPELADRRDETTLVIRASRDVPAGAVRRLILSAGELGLEHYAFAGFATDDPGLGVGEVPMSLPLNASSTVPADDLLTPLSVRLRGGERGQLASLEYGRSSLGNDDRAIALLRAELRRYRENLGPADAANLEVVIRYDDELDFEPLLNVLSVCRGFRDDDGQPVILVSNPTILNPEEPERTRDSKPIEIPLLIPPTPKPKSE